jgi:hypothetical protein
MDALGLRSRAAARRAARDGDAKPGRPDWFGPAAAVAPGNDDSDAVTRPRGSIVMLADWRTSGSARQGPQETEEPSSRISARAARRVDGRSRPCGRRAGALRGGGTPAQRLGLLAQQFGLLLHLADLLKLDHRLKPDR